jgi:hypothetical protein
LAEHNPDHVAQIAAALLSGFPESEPHHVKQAVSTARLILDEAHGVKPAPEPVVAQAKAEPKVAKAA